MSDLYSILGLTRACTQDDVRRAYKRLAVRWHPDKNPENREHAEREFKKVSEAYEVLSDPQKRAVYDRYGLEGLRGQAGRGTSAQMHDPFELFNMFFGGTDPFAAFDGRARGSRSRHTGGFDDDFGFGMGGFGGLSSMMNMMSRMSMHDDFGSMGGMGGGSFQMSSMSMGGMGGTSKSVSQQTVIRDGKQVTRKVTRTTQPDGTVHEDVEESIDDVPTSRRLAGGSTRRQQPSYHPALSHY